MIKQFVKIKISIISIILILTVFTMFLALPTSYAQEPGTKTTYPFIGATPNPVGLNQEVLIHVGITDPKFSVNLGWEGLTVTVTKPDGQSETLGPFKTDSTGGTGTVYIPTMVGTYTLQTHFPEQVLEIGTRWVPAGTIFEASNSEILELIVQTDPIVYYPGSPLPTEYWSRPIDAQHREWNTISGNWLDSGSMINVFPYNFPNTYAPYNDGPETAHILWTKPLTTGGLAGGELDDHSMRSGDAYQGQFGRSVIINGVLYYNRYWVGFANFPIQQGIIAVDLRTGEELWFKNNTRLMFGQKFYWDSYNMHGTLAYIWGANPSNAFTPVTNWDAYDAFTGEWVYSMENVPFGNRVYGPKGEIFIYTVNPAAGWMTMWNSSRVVSNEGSWEPDGNVYSNAGELGMEWNVSIPQGLPGVASAFLEDRIIGSDVPGWTGLANNPITFWGLSLESGQEGQLLFKEVWNPPAGNLSMLWGGASLNDGVFVVTAKDIRSLYGFSVDTGKQIWGPSTQQPYLDIYTFGEERAIARAIVIAEGKVFTVGMGGVLYCLNAETGNLIWEYTNVDSNSEILWSNNWPTRIAFITDGKIYLVHDEHSPVNPLPRGAPTICLDIETGEEVWRIDGAFRQTEWGGTAIIGDSIIALYNSYDQRIYALGKGPTSISLTTPNQGIPIGSSATLMGTVNDVSAGTKKPEITARFPNGVPAIADEFMSNWMKYVYMQFERPINAIGVPVKIQIIDPNGAYAWIGTATTDAYGNYGYSFVPQIKGIYTIMASFDGSDSYWGSHVTAYLTADPALEPYPTVTIPPYPGYQGPSASEVAQNVVSSLPEGVSANEVAQEILAQMPEYPETPEYRTSDIIIILLVAVAIIIGIVSYIALRKKN